MMLVLPCTIVAGDEIEAVDCLAYWQLRSAGLEREHGIESAKRSNKYQQDYKSGLDDLKKNVDPRTAVEQVFGSMKILLEDIDYDYDRTAELDAKYSDDCMSAK